MAQYKPDRFERETIITYCDGSEIAEVYTHNAVLKNKLGKFAKEHPRAYKLKNKDEYAETYIMPKKLLTFRQPLPKKPMSEEQRAAASERLRKYHASK